MKPIRVLFASTAVLGVAFAAPVQADDCDAACLSDLAGRAVAAMAAHERGDLPLGQRARYTENGQEIPIGDGAWGTLTGYDGGPAADGGATPPRYRLDVANAEAYEAVTLRGIVENGTPGLLALRIKARGGIISEMEAVVVRDETLNEGGGTTTLFQPRLLTPFVGAAITPPNAQLTHPPAGGPPPHVPAGELARLVRGYFEAMATGEAGHASLAASCVRRDNGVQVTDAADAPPLDPEVPDYRPFAMGCGAQIASGFFSNVGGVRIGSEVFDPDLGVVVAIVAVDHPATAKSFEAPGHGTIRYPGPRFAPEEPFDPARYFETGGLNMIVPTTDLAVYVFKISGGAITRIVSFTRGAPYGVATGW